MWSKKCCWLLICNLSFSFLLYQVMDLYLNYLSLDICSLCICLLESQLCFWTLKMKVLLCWLWSLLKPSHLSVSQDSHSYICNHCGELFEVIFFAWFAHCRAIEALYIPSWSVQGPKHARALSLKFEFYWVFTYLQASSEKDQAGLINLNVQ